MVEPREAAGRVEVAAELPPGDDERFAGYGVMGQPFTSGHVLGLRRFPASSVGPGYTSVWHRRADGHWTFYQDAEPSQACTRYFGSDVNRTVRARVDIDWPGPRQLRVRVADGGLEWTADLAPTPVTRLMNTVGSAMPARWWRNPRVLALMSRMASTALRLGRVRLAGVSSNGQRFVANPRVMWRISDTRASVGGEDLGRPGPLGDQARLGDFWIPQRGMFVVGDAFFEPFDPARHAVAAPTDRGAP